MPKQTAIDLNLVNTNDLVQELCRRHEAIIIIREDRKCEDDFYVTVKTQFGKHANKDAGFDLICAMELMSNAQFEIIAKHFELEPEDDSGEPE